MPTAVRSLLVAAAATLASVAVGVTVVGSEEPAPREPEPVSILTLAEVDTTVLAAGRSGFCSEITPEQVADALAGEPAASTAHDNGERVPIADGGADVAHEYGCVWTAADDAAARGWVFAPPVTVKQAGRLARAAVRAPGCRRLPDAPAYGASSIAVVCADSGVRVVSHRGLFGDAWLSCSLSAPGVARAELVERADRWCAAVAVAATAG